MDILNEIIQWLLFLSPVAAIFLFIGAAEEGKNLGEYSHIFDTRRFLRTPWKILVNCSFFLSWAFFSEGSGSNFLLSTVFHGGAIYILDLSSRVRRLQEKERTLNEQVAQYKDETHVLKRQIHHHPPLH